METLRLHPNLFIDADRRRPLSEPLTGAFDEAGADAVVIEEDAGFPHERREARRVWQVLLKLLMSAIADVGQTIGNTDNLMAIGLSFHERNEIDVAVSRDGAPNARSHQDHTDEVAPAAATNMAQGHCDKLFESRFVDLVRLFRINDDFQLTIGQPSDDTWIFWRQRDFDPLAVQTERVGDLKNPADVLERHNF